MDPHWKTLLELEVSKDYFQNLMVNIKREREKHHVFPPPNDVFNAFNTPFSEVKVVILGQDPYHGPGQAHGLAFSVLPKVKKLPPSLRNIFKELNTDLGCALPSSGCLDHWARQGVLLLNTVLTVRSGEPGSHKHLGWETFTDQVVNLLSKREDSLVFILWGSLARSKRSQIGEHHFVIESPHPSPFSSYQGFFGSKPFSRTNELLVSIGKTPIAWGL